LRCWLYSTCLESCPWVAKRKAGVNYAAARDEAADETKLNCKMALLEPMLLLVQFLLVVTNQLANYATAKDKAAGNEPIK
jgi:hypothetical protein